MADYRRKSLTDNILSALQKSGDITLAYLFQKEMAKQRFFEQEEYNRLVEDVTQRVIENIKATVDLTDVFMQIEDLRQAINSLGR